MLDAVGQFTYWSKRTFAYNSNSGLRLDYFVCTDDLARSSSSSDGGGPCIVEYYSRHDHSVVKNSDHSPIVLIVKP